MNKELIRLSYVFYVPLIILLLATTIVLWINSIVKFPLALLFGQGELLLKRRTYKRWYRENIETTKELWGLFF